MKVLECMRYACAAIVLLCCGVSSLLGQCVYGWESIGSYPGTSRNPRITLWDPDGTGPAGELVLAASGGNAGNEGRTGVAAWDGESWRVLGSASAVLVASHESGALYGYRARPGSDAELLLWDAGQQDWRVIADAPPQVINAMLTLPDGDVVLAGTFRGFHGTDYVTRWDAQVGEFVPFAQVNSPVATAFRVGRRVCLAGFFTQLAGAACPGVCIGEEGLSGFEWGALPPLPNNSPTLVMAAGEYQGRLLLTVNHRAFQLAPDGQSWTELQLPSGVSGYMDDFLVEPNGDLLLAGLFRTGVNRQTSLVAIRSSQTGEWLLPTTVDFLAAYVRAMRVRADGSVVLSADFWASSRTSPVGEPAKLGTGLIGWSPVTNEFTVYGDGFPRVPTYLLAEDDGSVLVIGPYGNYGNRWTGSVVRWSPGTGEFSAYRVPCPLDAVFALRRASGALTVCGLNREGLLAVMQLDEGSNEWRQLGSSWNRTGLRPRMRLAESRNGTLVCVDPTGVRSLANGDTEWFRLSMPAAITSITAAAPYTDDRMVLGGSSVVLWSPRTQIVEPLGIDAPSGVSVLAWDAEGQLLAAGSNLRVLDAQSGQWRGYVLGNVTSISALEVLPDGDLLMGCERVWDGRSERYTGIVRWNANSQAFNYVFPLNDRWVRPDAMTVSTRGDLVVAGEFDVIGPNVFSPRLAVFRGYDNRCPADADCSGDIDGDDAIAYFAAWEQGDRRADLDHDGDADGDDVIVFWQGVVAGC